MANAMNQNISSPGRRASNRHSIRIGSLGALCALVVLLAPLSATASSGSAIAKEAGLGAAAGLATVVYMPVKLAYAIGKTVVGGLAYVFSGGDSDVAKVVLTPATAGDYVVTPSNLKQEEPLEFFGRDPALREQGTPPSSVASAPSGW